MQCTRYITIHHLVGIFLFVLSSSVIACVAQVDDGDVKGESGDERAREPDSTDAYKATQKIVTVNGLGVLEEEPEPSHLLEALMANALITSGQAPDPEIPPGGGLLLMNTSLIDSGLGVPAEVPCDESKDPVHVEGASSVQSTSYWAVNGDVEQRLRDPWAQEVFERLVSCAVARGQTLLWSYDGQQQEFAGEWGLCPEWIKSPVSGDDECLEKVSACIVSRMNVDWTEVYIAMEFPTNGAGSAPPEDWDDYVLEEGAFWGTIFHGIDPGFQVFVEGDELVYRISGRTYTLPLPADPETRLAFHQDVMAASEYSDTPFKRIYACVGTDFEMASTHHGRHCAKGRQRDSRCVTTWMGDCPDACEEDTYHESGYYPACHNSRWVWGWKRIWEWPFRIRLREP